MPVSAAETTKEVTLVRVVSTPIASAAISSSRIAISVRPKDERTTRWTMTIVTAAKSQIQKKFAIFGMPA